MNNLECYTMFKIPNRGIFGISNLSFRGGKEMKRYLIISLIILTVLGVAGSYVMAQSGREHRGFGPGGAMVLIESEYEFLIKMIPHHEEAVDNAKFLRDNTNRDQMKEFAENIIETQSNEIEEMEKYLDKWYPNRTNDYEYQPMMRNYDGLEAEELNEAFLEDMIFHHMEAVMMSQQLIMGELDEHEEVYLLAESIRDSQRQEIFMMKDWLSSWY